MDAGVARLKRILHGVDGVSFSSQEYIHLYTYVPIHLSPLRFGSVPSPI
jgi:hypothetical protein